MEDEKRLLETCIHDLKLHQEVNAAGAEYCHKAIAAYEKGNTAFCHHRIEDLTKNLRYHKDGTALNTAVLMFLEELHKIKYAD